MSDKRLTNSFKSYVGIDDELHNSSNEESFSEQLVPRLLPGEMLIAEAQNVLMFAQVRERKQGRSGVLCVTNFKLSFITADERTKEEISYQDTLQLGENDVCLSNVDALYLMGDKKRKLLPGKNCTEKVKGLHVVCKNMRVMTFSFKFSPIGHGKTLTNTLLHHAFPKRHQLLFAYDYSEPHYVFKTETVMFREAGDWGKEMARTECQGWRLSGVNHDFQMSTSLPKWLVVPSRVLDWQLSEAARHFRAGRPPLWCWSSPQGAALVRMADIVPTITDRVQENIMLESVRKSHPRLAQPIVLDLTKDLPSPREIHFSYNKLRELCTPEDIKQFWIQDQHFLSILENTKWLQFVSACLNKALAAAKTLYRDVTVVLQEVDGRDMCCVISCLTLLLVDAHFRTVHGFQSLVQREWVIMGHPFCTRLAHVYSTESNKSPVFLLFLDCVWQLLQQFPTYFQFTETYLTMLWESALVSTFDTFLFDCERDRVIASTDPNNPLILRSVWEELLTGKDAPIFFNPLYNPVTSTTSPSSINFLRVRPSLPNLQIWQQCYFRHIPLLEIRGGGNPQVDLMSRLLVAQVENEGECPVDSVIGLDSLSKIGSFFPFTNSTGGTSPVGPPAALLVSSLSLNTSFHSTEIMLDSQSILNVPD
ncbi:myotubularin-related protein 10-B isoform X2 [Rhodnius prolixus]|uniref:myotubularin-related protein 10-B isoform X2 n=1 Tax=Rhodnius prolixus TaxID=13249 RepID=UPI003D188AA6